jgi:type VI secretion system protein VasD
MIARRTVLWMTALAAAGCSSQPPPPAVLTLNIKAGADQNPDPSGHPSPVAVRLFELAGTAKFERADFFALTEREQQTLAAEGQGSEEFVLNPGESRTITRELKKGVQFIGIAVQFRDIDHAQWRAMSPVAASGPSQRALSIGRLSASLS